MKQHTSIRLSKLTLALIVALSAAPAFAQNTTSALDGHIYGSTGQPVAGADVTIVHVPSGTVSHATTDASGRYLANSLRVGGPYKVTSTKDGQTQTQDNVYLQLAEIKTVDLALGAATGASNAVDLGAIEVKGNRLARLFNADRKGLSTSISNAQLQAIPDGDRSIQSVARMDPRISVTDRDAGAISANGKNFRYNCITVDNVNAGDPFGLESNGLASVGSPISKDTIESYQLSTSNFDVSTRGCVGANINAVTKSGTNEFHGSLYYSYRTADDDFMGKITPIGGTTALPYSGWQREWTSGLTVGGPIVQDKLFFFAGYEKSARIGIGATSAPSDGTGSATLVAGLNTAFFNSVLSEASTVGLTPGDRTLADLTDERYLAKFDWNISDRQRAVFRFNETKESQPVPTGSSTSVTPNSNWYVKDRNIKSYIGQLFSDWTDSFSTEADLSYSHITQFRGPLDGIYQPSVQVTTTTTSFTPSVTLGTEFSSQVNALDIKSLYGYFAGTWHLGDHTIKAGFNGNEDKVYNAFMQGFDGSYTYQGLANFQAGKWEEYTIKRPAPGLTLDGASAVFKKQQYGAFIEDTWQANDRFSFQYGLRYDVPKFPSAPLFNPCFASAPGTAFTAHNPDGSTLCTATKGGFGYANNATPSGNGSIEPRVSFNYKFDSKYLTQLRGGAGIFVSDIPTVWYSNEYGNPGITVVTYDIVNAASSAPGTLLCSSNGKNFTPAVGGHCAPGQIAYVKQGPIYSATNPLIPGTGTLVLGSGVAQMGVDTIDPNFKMPNTTQFALAFDRELPWLGLVGSAEFNQTITNDDIFYKNLNLGAPTFRGPDGRIYYCNPSKLSTCSSNAKFNANPSFANVTELTNTHQGESSTLTLSLNKPMSNDWAGMVALRVGHATDVNPGTSSVANSNILGNVWVNPNTDIAATSNYSVPLRGLLSLTWQHRFFGDYQTSVSLFGDMHSGAPYSWISGTDTNGDSYSRDLIYIPSSTTDVEWAPAVTATQKQQFMNYVNSDPYLRKHEGEIAGRNTERSPWVNQFDVNFRQQIPGLFNGNKGELRFDIFNLGNLLNRKWGIERRASFPLTRNLANVSGIDPATGKYIYDISSGAYKDANGNYAPGSLVINEGQTPGAPVPSQRWSVMMTVSYRF
jgi:hypothetical protein